MQRLQTRPQFQAVLAGAIIAKTEHFALHCNRFGASNPSNFGVADAAGKSIGYQGCYLDSRIQTHLHPLFPVVDVWLGAMVPKRWAKRAVTRNAIKRQIYVACSGLQDRNLAAAFVVRLRREFSRKQFLSAESALLKEAVRSEVRALLQAGLERQ